MSVWGNDAPGDRETTMATIKKFQAEKKAALEKTLVRVNAAQERYRRVSQPEVELMDIQSLYNAARWAFANGYRGPLHEAAEGTR